MQSKSPNTGIRKTLHKTRRKTRVVNPHNANNKRRTIEMLLEDTTLGHDWQTRHKSKGQITIRCRTCELYLKQNESQESFDRKAGHPCLLKGGTRPPEEVHDSHKVVNAGNLVMCAMWSQAVGCIGEISAVCLARFVLFRDLGRSNVGVRTSRTELKQLLLLDGRSWQPCEERGPRFPNRQRAGGMWRLFRAHFPEAVDEVRSMILQMHGNLPALMVAEFAWNPIW